jgi:pyruvate/2-oxoglutarate dehydrogenase complex dihydrolipoamide acyltransferase (E2) component
MISDVVMPKLGVEMAVARVVAWSRGSGERIERDDNLLTIETDKVNFDVPAPATGLVHVVARVDEEVPVGAVLGHIAETNDEYRTLTAAPVRGTVRPAPIQAAALRATPLARKIAKLHGIDIGTLRGSGARGQVREADVWRAMEGAMSPGPVPRAAEATTAPSASAGGRAIHRRVPFKGMRHVIARRLHEGLQAMAQMTDLGELDVTELVRCRDQLKLEPALVGGTITYTDFFIKIAALVVRELRQFNASVEGDEIVEWAPVNIGFATSVEGGLIVPVVRGADGKPLTAVRTERSQLAERAKAGTLRREDVSDGTFTITNFGSYGSWMGTPLINPPQVAVLGLGEIRQKPAIHDGQIVPRWLMGYGLTIDHRVLDGADAGRFLKRFRELCERPWVLLVG